MRKIPPKPLMERLNHNAPAIQAIVAAVGLLLAAITLIFLITGDRLTRASLIETQHQNRAQRLMQYQQTSEADTATLPDISPSVMTDKAGLFLSMFNGGKGPARGINIFVGESQFPLGTIEPGKNSTFGAGQALVKPGQKLE